MIRFPDAQILEEDLIQFIIVILAGMDDYMIKMFIE